ncbi:hypothetical protein J132_04344 [Termitomyces sp. J132]|nr:hypothetical protein H2248_008207 [Termitomyces sp. 'cryptogamus']KNZ72063.1 hypothetical protein J132_04344 [Termitomyces sp. J132]
MGTIDNRRKRLERQDSNEPRLLSLSDDLFQMILEFMTEDELYTIACVCALLNDLSLRVFFSERGIKASGSKLNTVSLSLPKDRQFLSVLHISFFIDFIQEFNCELLHASPKGIDFRRDSEHVLELILPEKGTSTAPFDVGKVNLYMEHTYVRIDPDDTCDRLFSSSCVQINFRYGIGEFSRYERDIAQEETGKVPFYPSILHIVDREAFTTDLPQILSIMQTLRTLRIETDTMLWETRQLLPHIMPQQSFPSLIDLTTTPAYAADFRSASFPNLKSFNILVPDVNRMFTYISQQEFKAIAPLLLSAEQTELQILVTADFSEVEVEEQDILVMGRSLEDYHLNGLGSGTSLDNISVLRVMGLRHIVTRESADSFYNVLTYWLKLFRGLHQVEFYDHAEDLGQAKLPAVYPLIYAIHKKCPHIATLSIHGVKYDIAKTVYDYGAGNNGVAYTGSTLGDLNEDIFFLIFDYLSIKEVYSLSMLCRNLREWALSVYLHRRGIEDPSESVELQLTNKDFDQDLMTDISALTLSSIRRIAKLTIKVTPHFDVFHIWEFLSRVSRLVQKLSSIGTATLELGDAVPTIPSGLISEHSRVVWTQVVLSIFNALGEKSNTLIVRGNGVLGSLTFSIAEGSPVPSRLIRLHLPKFPLKHKLSSLKMNERAVMMPLFNSWAARAFKGSEYITNLEFLDVSNYGGSYLTVLGHTFASVEQLRIYSRTVLPPGILASFSRLQSVKEMTLVGSGQFERKKIEIPAALHGSAPPLPLLERLTTLPQYFSFLIEGASLKELQHLSIILPHVVDETKSCLSALPSLASYSDTLKGWSRLTLNLHVYIENLTRLQPAEITADGWEQIAQITKGIFLHQAPPPRYQQPVPPDAMQGIENLRQWLALFPLLETLEFRGIKDVAMIDNVLQQLKAAGVCPGVKKFLVNGNERPDTVEKDQG